MEVMIAALILTLGVVASMSIIGTAQARVARAERRRIRQHIMALVTECYLMGGPNVIFPDGMLPNGYTASCELLRVDDLHDEAVDPINEWMLGEFFIQVFGPDGALVGENHVRKMLKAEDLGVENDIL